MKQLHQFFCRWIWSEYWRLQWLTILPLLILAIFPLLIILGYWLSEFLRP